MRLQPLCFCFSTHAPLFSMVCGLFFKNTRVGCTQQKPSSRISNLPTRRPRTVCKPVTPGLAGIDLHVPCFHTVTNPFFRKSFIFTSICVAPCFFSAHPVEAIDARIPKSGTLFDFGMG